MQSKTILVLRPFYHDRKVLEKDKIYTLPALAAAEAVAAKKAQFVEGGSGPLEPAADKTVEVKGESRARKETKGAGPA